MSKQGSQGEGSTGAGRLQRYGTLLEGLQSQLSGEATSVSVWSAPAAPPASRPPLHKTEGSVKERNDHFKVQNMNNSNSTKSNNIRNMIITSTSIEKYKNQDDK